MIFAEMEIVHISKQYTISKRCWNTVLYFGRRYYGKHPNESDILLDDKSEELKFTVLNQKTILDKHQCYPYALSVSNVPEQNWNSLYFNQ